MKAFFDTSVLVAVFYGDHQHHDASIEALLKFDKSEARCAAHSLAEVYASLTRMPGQHRVTAAQAMLFLETLQSRMTMIALEPAEYFTGIRRLASAGLTGGSIYDGLLALCALKANADVIYTWNLRHFRQCGPEVAARLITP